MKKPIKKDYCSPFSMDDKIVLFDSKQYAKDAAPYIEYLEGIIYDLIKTGYYDTAAGEKAIEATKHLNH